MAFDEWAILELFGHRKLAGRVSEASIGGASFIRIDVPADPPLTQFYGGAAVYSISPCSEGLARQYARGCSIVPVHRYELPAAGLDDDPAAPTEDEGIF